MPSAIVFTFNPEAGIMEMRGACSDEELFTLTAASLRVLAERQPIGGRSMELYRELLALFGATEAQVNLARLQ